MNDWDIKETLILVISIQLGLLGSIGLDFIGFNIPILRQLLGFIYLIFIPGMLILRILKLHDMGSIKTVLFSIGLSLSTLMATGFFINLAFSSLSFDYLIFSLNLVSLILCLLCYLIDGDYSKPTYIDLNELFSAPILFLCIIPFMSIFGTYSVNFKDSNLILMLMILIIAIVVLLICFDTFLSPKYYPLAIWIVAISLIWHNTLISSYIIVGDSVEEYFFSNLAIKSSFWNWTIKGTYNSVLCNVILAPIFYHILNLDLTWIFKIVYPLLFSFVSIGVYYITLQSIKNTKFSFLSSFLFISVSPFYETIPLITKQSIAEIFLVSLVMLLTENNNAINKTSKSILYIIFSMSLIVSHYGTSYLFMFSLVFVSFFLLFEKSPKINKLVERFFPISNNMSTTHNDTISTHSHRKYDIISPNFILLFITFTLAWFIYISNSSVFSIIMHLGKNIVNTIFIDFFSPESSRGLYLITRNETSLLRTLNKILYFTIQFFIIIGYIHTIKHYNKSRYSTTYMCLSLFWLIILFSAIAISGFAVMDPHRLFHLSLILLSPFSVIGGITVCKLFFNYFTNIKSSVRVRYSFNLLSVFFVIFLLFNTGFVYEVAKDHPSSISISQRTTQHGDIIDKASFYGQYIVTQDVFSGKWLGENIVNGSYIYKGDRVQGSPSLTIYSNVDKSSIKFFDNSTAAIGDGYIYLSYLNLVEGTGFNFNNTLQQKTVYEFTDVRDLLKDKNAIYNNGGSKILLS